MPSRPDLPCADCGKLMWRGSTSLPEGKARCLPCRRANKVRSPKSRFNGTCSLCGAGVESKSASEVKTCRACRLVSRDRLAERANCLTCGKEFAPWHERRKGKGLEGPRVCCSLECGRKRNGILNKKPDAERVRNGKTQAEWISERGKRQCRECGSDFLSEAKRRLCDACREGAKAERRRASLEAYAAARACRDCGVCVGEFQRRCEQCAAIHKRAMRRTHRREHHRNHRSRARKYGVPYESFKATEIFDRDGWRCYLCGVKVLAEYRPPRHDRNPTLDHVVPMSKGGGHLRTNVRCCCWACNVAKGDRGGYEQLLLVG